MNKAIEYLKAVLRGLELPIMVFPVLVTCLVALGFVFKCPCSICEWWVAVAVVAGLVLFRAKDTALAGGVVLALGLGLVVLWIVTRTLCTSGPCDMLTYHQPAIRMMLSGWNPVWQGTPDGLREATGLDTGSFWLWHVIAMPKGVWYFSAAACQFTGAHFNLAFPLSPILLCSLFYVVYESVRAVGRVFAVCACALIFFLIGHSYDIIVDQVVEIAAVGLLVTMASCLRRRRWEWMRLITFSFWMLVSKQTAGLQCALFWLLFVLAWTLIQKKIELKRMLGMGGILFILVAIVTVSPYLTSTINYGSPVYPRYSGDEQKWPTQNLTADFFCRNEDAATMGRIGAYVNSFVSTTVAKTYYCWKCQKDAFCPNSRNWKHNGRHDDGSPTTWKYRMFFCCAIVLILLFGRTPGRFISACVIFGTLALPTEMIGYLRYTPWLTAALGYAMLEVVVCCGRRRTLILAKLGLCAAAILYIIPSAVFDLAVRIDTAAAIRQSITLDLPRVLFSSDRPIGTDQTTPYQTFSANLLLLQRDVPALAQTEIVWERCRVQNPERWQLFFDDSCLVAPEYDMNRFSELRKVWKIAERRRRLMAFPVFIVRTYLLTLPKSIWEVIHG